MDDVDEFLKTVSKPKYAGIDAFFTVLTLVLIASSPALVFVAWRLAF